MPKSPLKKTDTDIIDKKKSKIEERILEIDKICENLFQSSYEFNAETAYNQILNYIKKYERFLYSIISEYIFHKIHEKEEFDVVNQNIEILYQHMENLKEKDPKNEDTERMEKVILKLYDHVNLAYRQFDELKESEEDFKRKFEKNAAPFQEKLSREMSMQLLTMISIFTALAFLMFGGISSLGSIFSNHELPVLKVMIIGSIWGLCILNVVFVFLFCVGKMTNVDFASTKESNANIAQKYPVVWWSDLIILTVLACSIWTYYVRKEHLDSWFTQLCVNGSFWPMIIGYVIILGIFIFMACKLFKQVKKN